MTTDLMTPLKASTVEAVLLHGDLSRLTPLERVSYYNRVCESLGLNPLTKPFDYLKLNGKEILYAKRDCTEQLRKIHGVSITAITSQRIEDVFVVTATAQDKTGRTDASTGAVPLAGLKGEALANALMKAETKAKRRVTLSLCGLGTLDETEIETIPAAVVARPVPASVDAGEWVEEPYVDGLGDAPEWVEALSDQQELGLATRPPQRSGDVRVITEKMAKRCYAIWKSAGRRDSDVTAWLKKTYGFSRTDQITSDVYNEIVTALEASGPLA